jgi:uncharacterized damage-inducible protein DinB
MPAAHALIQARADVHAAARELTPTELWARPGEAASVGFHLKHIAGSLDRLLTYAAGRQLDTDQLRRVRLEGAADSPPEDAAGLLAQVDAAIDTALDVLRRTHEDDLLQPRAVGRMQLPSNVLGLLFHSAEHTQRHAGQVITTAKVVRSREG